MNPATPPEPTSAYEWVGGEVAVRTLVYPNRRRN